MKRKIGVILVIIIFLALASILFLNTISGRLFLWGIHLNQAGFKLNSFQDLKNVNPFKIQSLEANRNDGTILIVRKIESEDHQKYIEDKKFILKSIFEPVHSPYPEVITNIIDCPQEFKPRESSVSNGTVYTLFAGERFNFGICSKDLIKYRAAYGIFDCKNKGIFEITIFGNNEKSIMNLAESFDCQ